MTNQTNWVYITPPPSPRGSTSDHNTHHETSTELFITGVSLFTSETHTYQVAGTPLPNDIPYDPDMPFLRSYLGYNKDLDPSLGGTALEIDNFIQ